MGTLLVGLGLVLFFWAVSLLCLFLFPASVSMEVEFVVFGREWPILWLISSFLERAVEVLDGVDLRCSRRSVLWLDLL